VLYSVSAELVEYTDMYLPPAGNLELLRVYGLAYGDSRECASTSNGCDVFGTGTSNGASGER
jgi:hypothetical protein